MAKKSWSERNKKRMALVKKYAAKRVVNRCPISGRRHGYFRKFNCSRLTFRELALQGLIPGVTKASW
jgi:small subunit ribosomal protein S14